MFRKYDGIFKRRVLYHGKNNYKASAFQFVFKRTDHPYHGLITQLREQFLPDSTGICGGGGGNHLLVGKVLTFLKTILKRYGGPDSSFAADFVIR